METCWYTLLLFSSVKTGKAPRNPPRTTRLFSIARSRKSQLRVAVASYAIPNSVPVSFPVLQRTTTTRAQPLSPRAHFQVLS